eukprot:533159-Heterocapsa_arctica.AAC.1
MPAASPSTAARFDLLMAGVEQFTTDLRIASLGGVDPSYGTKAYCASGGVRYVLQDRGPGMMKAYVREPAPAAKDVAAEAEASAEATERWWAAALTHRAVPK